MRERGVVEQIRRKWWDQQSKCGIIPDIQVKTTPSLEFMSVAGVYIILACGAIISLVMLFIEVKYPGLFTRKCAETFKVSNSILFEFTRTEDGIQNMFADLY